VGDYLHWLAAFTIATIPKRTASGSVGHSVTTAAKSGSICDSRAKVWAKAFLLVSLTSCGENACADVDAGSIPAASTLHLGAHAWIGEADHLF